MFSPNHPLWHMAFRPLYLLAAAYGAISVLLWGFGYQGTATLSGFLWHAHEMIWGYTGAVVVAFLLTAVATWTGQPPLRGKGLILLVLLWLAARVLAFTPFSLLSGVSNIAFFWFAAAVMASAVIRTRNKRNYLAAAALFVLGCTQFAFHIALSQQSSNIQSGLHAGLMVVAGFIGLIGLRVIPFFTARRFGSNQKSASDRKQNAALLIPVLMAVLIPFDSTRPIAGAVGLLGGTLLLWECLSWFDRRILGEPMVWVLHLGFAASAAGLASYGAAQFTALPQGLGIHLLAVGGIGVLTLGMMTRTALGHTGRPIYPAPKIMPFAFGLMGIATLVRAFAEAAAYMHPTAYQHSLRLSAALFALALLIYALRYLPWLTCARADGK